MPNKHYHDIDDKELLERYYAERDNELLGILMQRYTILLLGVCMKYLRNEEDAKDSVQQVFLKAINELQKYKVEYFKSWLYMVAKNHCLMKLRGKGKINAEIKDDMLAVYDEAGQRKAIADKDLLLSNMETALKQLNAEQQVCVTLFYLEKKTYQQITELTGYPLMQVKSNIQNGKRNLKIQLERMQKDD